MLKQSYMYLGLQVFNIFIGLFITLYIAKNVDVQTFAIFAIYSVVTTLFMTFSFGGYETVLIRNLLHWKKIGKNRKIINYISYALFSRFIISICLVLPMLLYIYYISEVKFNSEYFILFSSFIISGIFTSLTNANGLILKAFNRYILSFSIMTLSSIFSRLIAMYIFINNGFIGFISVLVLTPLLTFLVSFFIIRPYFSLKEIKFKYFFKLKKNKYFILSGYTNYFKNSIDQFLISLFLSIEILAVYNLAKRVEEIGKTVNSGFFDPIIQKLVGYKSDNNLTSSYKDKIFLIRNIFLVITFFIILIFNFYINDIISLFGLGHYDNLNLYLMFASWTPIIIMIYKVEYNIIYLFEKQKILFKIDFFNSLLTSIIMLFFLNFVEYEYIYLNRVIIGIFLIIFFLYYYKYKFCKSSLLKSKNNS